MAGLEHALTILLAVSGILAGILVGRMAKRELKPGKAWLRGLYDLLIAGMLTTVFFALRLPPLLATMAGILMLLVLRSRKLTPHSLASAALCGFSLWLSGRTEHFLLVASLVFLSGLPGGSILAAQKIEWRRVAEWCAVSLALGLLSLLV